jgi:hypothetical protein
MGDGFQRGLWGIGSYGDPDPDVSLPATTLDALLDGQLALVPAEFRSLADTVAALCGPPSAAELRGEPRARAAYRALGSAAHHGPGARTLPLELPDASRPRRAGRARHRSTGSTRPPGRPWTGARLGMVSGVAAAVIALTLGVAYAGGVFSANVKSQSSAAPPSSARPGASASGSANVAGVSATHAPKDTPTPTATAATSGSPAGTPLALCEAWLQNPWRPGAKNWDNQDFDKLSALAGGPQMVLFYCWTNLPKSYWGSVHYLPRYSDGHWAWPPGGKLPLPVNGNSQDGLSDSGGNSQGGASSQGKA